MSQVLHPKALMTLMFGSTAAVYAFNRVSRSLWFLINVYLKVPTAVYCYDYPMFSPETSAQETDNVVSDFLDLLGWRHDRTGPKGKPFASSFDVLGMNLDLSGLRNANSVTLKNKEGRVENFFLKFSMSRKIFVFATGLSRALDAVPHGIPKWMYSGGRFFKRSIKI